MLVCFVVDGAISEAPALAPFVGIRCLEQTTYCESARLEAAAEVKTSCECR